MRGKKGCSFECGVWGPLSKGLSEVTFGYKCANTGEKNLKQRQCFGVQGSWRSWHGWTPEETRGLMEASIHQESGPPGDGPKLRYACWELAACITLRQPTLSGALNFHPSKDHSCSR